jgi:hypothetical protein
MLIKTFKVRLYKTKLLFLAPTLGALILAKPHTMSFTIHIIGF